MRSLATLLAALSLLLVPAGARADTTGDVVDLLTDVTGADMVRYDAKDTTSTNVEALKAIDCQCGPTSPRYLGVSHAVVDGAFQVRLSSSDDLATWTYQRTLDVGGSQAVIERLPGGGYLVVDENTTPGVEGGLPHVRLLHYADLDALVAAAPSRVYDAPRALAPTAEGTPEIRAIDWHGTLGDVTDATIRLSMHYYWQQDVDRQALGTLTDWSTWSAVRRDGLNGLLSEGLLGGGLLGGLLHLGGNWGGRDGFDYDGRDYEVVEVQAVKNDWSTWRSSLYDVTANRLLALPMRVHYGQTSFGNHKVSVLDAPTGTGRVLFGSAFLFSEGAPNGAGQMLYYHRLP